MGPVAGGWFSSGDVRGALGRVSRVSRRTRALLVAAVTLSAWQLPHPPGSVATEGASPSGVPRSAPEVHIAYGRLPLTFEPNVGQTNERVQFLARGARYALFLASSEATFVLAEPRQPDRDRAARTEPGRQYRG